jgi:hypothetical protein
VLEHQAGRSLNWEMVNLMGQQVRQGSAQPGRNSIDLKGLENGVYFVRLESGETRKMILSR